MMGHKKKMLKALGGATDSIIRRAARMAAEGERSYTTRIGTVVKFREVKALAATLSSIRAVLRSPHLAGDSEDVEEFLYGSFIAFDKVIDLVNQKMAMFDELN